MGPLPAGRHESRITHKWVVPCYLGQFRGTIDVFEEARLLGSTEKSIRLQTQKGTDIPNLIELEPGEQQRRVYRLFRETFGKRWKERKPVTGVYNCAGHVWASRRTAILAKEDTEDTAVWRLILEEDGYRRLPEGEHPCSGDLVLYFDREKGWYLHVGEVLWPQKGIAEGSPPIPLVLSKWNSVSGETIHSAFDVPYSQQGYDLQIEFWTDRPAPTTQQGSS